MEAEAIQHKLEAPQIIKKGKIKKLILDGFKSFGKRTELQFGDDFNVILGPNGSGKSNVLDAMCFVLGKSSSKQLRAEKSSNLIYNGGKTKQPAKSAEVSLVFDNEDNTFAHADKEIKISRIVKQNGNSTYKINGKTTTRQSFIELLNSAKIDPDGYNIILQGDIVRLVEMSPNERREIIEEIAGIGVYEDKKKQALNELSKVDNKLNEAEIILKERHGYLRDLKKDRDQALKYKGLNDRLKQAKASYVKTRLDKQQRSLDKSEKYSLTHKEKLEKIQGKIKGNRDHITQQKNLSDELSKRIEQQGEVEQIKIQKEIEQLRVEIATNKTRIGTIKSDVDKVEQRKKQLKQSLDELSGKKGNLAEHRGQLTAQLATLGKSSKEIGDRIKAFKQKHNLSDEAEIDKKFEDIDNKAEEKQKKIHELREKQQKLIREKDKIEFQLVTIDEKIAKVQELEDAHKEEIELLRKKKEEFKKTTLELNKMLNQDSDDAKTLAKHRTELHELHEDEHKLQIKQSSVQESISANIAVKKILENRQQLGEVYGTIAELGSSESKYSQALEVAAGNKLQSIVVGDDNTAANGIKFLKKQKLGVATFLPLNKTKPVDVDKETKAFLKKDGVVGLAIDLIDFDPKFTNAFSRVLGSTIVVRTIDVARKLGIGKARMVTLDGDLCEPSGAMIGGFRQKKTAGGFRARDIENKLQNIQKKISTIEAGMAKLQQQRRENEDKITRFRELKATLEGEIIKQEKSLHLDVGDLGANQQYKKELQKSVETISSDLQKIENDIVAETKELTGLKVEKQSLRTKISELRNPSVLAELSAFEEKKRQLDQEIIRLDEQKKNLDAQLQDSVGRDVESTQKLLADLDKEKEAFKSELKNMGEIAKLKEKDLGEKEKEQAKFYSQYKGLFDKKNKLEADIKTHEEKVYGLEEQSRKEELSLNTYSIEEARLKAEIAGLTAEFEQYEGVELVKKPEEELKKEITSGERLLANIGNVNMRSLEIYDTVEKEYSGLQEKKGTLLNEKEEVVKLMEEIESRKTELFTKTLASVNDNFKNIFRELNTKGDAELVLENKEKPFEGGLRINVKITGSKFLDIRSLSGGEKTMTALAFLFSIQEHEPATFYILDEVDAALDKHNSEKLAKLIKNYTTKAQYVVISHNDAVIAEGDLLYGISMKQESGLSNVVSLRV